MTEDQKQAIKCAHADLIGAIQAYNQDDILVHNWKAHKESIIDLENAFPFLENTAKID